MTATGRPSTDEAEAALKRDRLATLNRFIVGTLMPEWEADGWWYEHDDDPPTVPDVQQGFLLERDDVRVLVTVALVEYDAADEDEDEGCTHCGGEGLTDCDDPIQCTSSRCDGQMCPCQACGGSGRGEDQVIF